MHAVLHHDVAAGARASEPSLTHDFDGTQEHCYASADSVVDDDHAAAERPEPAEVLNSMTPDSMPPHIVKLKAGCMVMLMRNVHKDLGLVNGARLFVRDFQPRCVECEIAGGVHKGRRVFIPRMVFTSDDESGRSFTLRRRQLPPQAGFCYDSEQVAGTDPPQSGALPAQ